MCEKKIEKPLCPNPDCKAEIILVDVHKGTNVDIAQCPHCGTILAMQLL